MTIVYALDIGVYDVGLQGQVLSKTTAAWCRATSGTSDLDSLERAGTPGEGVYTLYTGKDAQHFACGRSLERLAVMLASDIRAGNQVALALRRPCGCR